MFRAIREIQPSYIVAENVSGLISWNGGMVFNEVQSDMETEGYEILPFILPACAVNAPHRRDRVWFIAKNTRSDGCGNGEYEKSVCVGNIGKLGAGSKERILRKEIESDATDPNGNDERLLRGQQPEQGFATHALDSDISGHGIIADTEHKGLEGHNEWNGCPINRSDKRLFVGSENKQPATNPDSGRQPSEKYRQAQPGQFTEKGCSNYWQNFPTQPPIRGIYDGISDWILRNIKSEIYATISKRHTDKDLQEVWDAIQSQEVQEQIRGLYEIHGEGVLLQTMQLCSPSNNIEKGFSVWSEKASEGIMRKLSKYGTITDSPQGRELEKQFTEQFADTLPYLSHEIALVAMETEKAAAKFKAWHRNESIKAYGNAIVPQVALQIFKAIQELNEINQKQH
jgi:site-specific DNA-cytosine methylase